MQRNGLMCASSLAEQPIHTLEISNLILLFLIQEYEENLKDNFCHAFINQVLGADTRRKEVRNEDSGTL